MIPRVIHQIWKTPDIPASHRYWSSSWQRLNSNFKYRIWNHSDIERLIEKDFPTWKSVFYGYKENKSHIDLARYLILKKHGGLYVDLDCECLRPQEDLLTGHKLVVGTEPITHLNAARSEHPQLPYLACSGFLGSVPDHPFWDHLFEKFKQNSKQVNPLDPTGGLVLTEALLNSNMAGITILDPEILYPADKQACSSGKINDLEFFDKITKNSYAIHHWKNPWSHPQADHHALQLPGIAIRIVEADKIDAELKLDPAPEKPLISCLMVTRGKPNFVRAAINGYLNQTYKHSELVIVTEADPAGLSLVRAEYDDPRIRWKFVDSAEKLPLGALRNLSVDEAVGDYIANWDDDDLNDPSRLAHQLKYLQQTNSPACMLLRWMVWWPSKKRIFISQRRLWEGSLLCRTSILPRYPEIEKAEDTFLIKKLLQQHNITAIDVPRLYIYVCHGANTWHDAHFDFICKKSTANFSGEKYDQMLNEIGRRVDIKNYPLRDIG